jgi:hypothetical protein
MLDVMASVGRDELLASFNGNGPAPADAIRRVETDAGIRFDSEYVRFLTETNGGEGFIGPSSYAILWRVEELLEMNVAYEVAEYAPGLFLFGSDGGGEAFGFDRKSGAIVSVPFVGMDPSLAKTIASRFDSFFEALAVS